MSAFSSPKVSRQLVLASLVLVITVQLVALGLTYQFHSLTADMLALSTAMATGKLDEGITARMLEVTTQVMAVNVWLSRLTWAWCAAQIMWLGTFIAWLYRLQANLPALGHAKPRWRPWMALSILLPPVNIVLPYLMLREVAQHSFVKGTAAARGLVELWWMSLLGSGFAIYWLFRTWAATFPRLGTVSSGLVERGELLMSFARTRFGTSAIILLSMLICAALVSSLTSAQSYKFNDQQADA